MKPIRLFHTIYMAILPNGIKRANYIRKHKLFHEVGNNVMIQSRKLPLYGNLISLHNNVWLATNVSFITHDVIHYMLNYSHYTDQKLQEYVGCIEIMDNVFVGANSTILYGVQIGCNVIIGSGSVVTKDLEANGVYAGIPAKYICSFDQFVKKRIENDLNIRKIDLYNENISTDLCDVLWKRFYERRKKNIHESN